MRYPAWKVSEEARFVVERMNAQMATQTALFQMALSSIPSMSVKPAATKKATKAFEKQIKELIHGAE